MSDKHLIEDPPHAICPYCDEPITTGPTENYGGMLLHKECFEDYGRDQDYEARCEDDSRDYIPTEGELEYDYQRYYGYGH